MRQGPNKRPRGRNGRKPNIPSRHQTFESSGPEVRIRGSAHQVHEKYLTLARDATSSGDRVAAENFFQHAEHYFRIINASTDPRPPGSGQPIAGDGRRGDGEAGIASAAGRDNGATEPQDRAPIDGGDGARGSADLSPVDDTDDARHGAGNTPADGGDETADD
jgi:hypothetical protein